MLSVVILPSKLHIGSKVSYLEMNVLIIIYQW